MTHPKYIQQWSQKFSWGLTYQTVALQFSSYFPAKLCFTEAFLCIKKTHLSFLRVWDQKKKKHPHLGIFSPACDHNRLLHSTFVINNSGAYACTKVDLGRSFAALLGYKSRVCDSNALLSLNQQGEFSLTLCKLKCYKNKHMQNDYGQRETSLNRIEFIICNSISVYC